jgi:hypothetical protein
VKPFQRRDPEDSPRRKERPINQLERYLKRNLKGARVKRDGPNVLVKYNGKNYRIYWDLDMWYVCYWDPQLGTMPKGTEKMDQVKEIIISDDVPGEPVDYKP